MRPMVKMEISANTSENLDRVDRDEWDDMVFLCLRKTNDALGDIWNVSLSACLTIGRQWAATPCGLASCLAVTSVLGGQILCRTGRYALRARNTKQIPDDQMPKDSK